MKKILLAAGLAALLPLPAAAQTHPAMVGVVVGSPGNQTGPDFVRAMMMADKYEVAAAKLALRRARDPAILEFARDMIQAHNQMAEQLQKVCDRALVGQPPTPPPAFDPPHQRLYRQLEGSGSDFEGIYVAQQLDDHR